MEKQNLIYYLHIDTKIKDVSLERKEDIHF